MPERLAKKLAALMMAGALACATKAAPSVVMAPVASGVPSSGTAPVTAASPLAVAAPSGDRGDLDSSIAIAIRMLEEKDYREFLEEFVAPDDRAHFEADGGLEKILPEFADDKADKLLQILKKTQGRTPRREENRAVFDSPRSKEVTWVLDHGRWYIKN